MKIGDRVMHVGDEALGKVVSVDGQKDLVLVRWDTGHRLYTRKEMLKIVESRHDSSGEKGTDTEDKKGEKKKGKKGDKQVDETVAKSVASNPDDAVEKYVQLKAMTETLERALQDHMEKNKIKSIKGNKGSSYTRIDRSKTVLDGNKVIEFCDENGLDPYSLGHLSVTEKSIGAQLGKEKGAEVIKTLRDAKLIKDVKYSYYSLKVETT